MAPTCPSKCGSGPRGLVLALALVAAGLAGLPACCETETGEQGLLVVSELGTRKSTLYTGGLTVIQATLEAQAPARDVALDFYATPAASSSCASPEHLLAHVTVPAIATPGADMADVAVVHDRLDKTSITYDKGAGNRRARVTRIFLLPNLPEGSYHLVAVAAAATERTCKVSPAPIAVKKPTGPQLVISSSHLGNHSFTLPSEEYRPLSRRPSPAFSLSVEILNTGLDTPLPAKATFSLELGGESHPLLIELTSEHGTPTLVDGLVFEDDLEGEQPDIFRQNEVRGATANIYLGESAVTALQALHGDISATLRMTVDKDNRLGQMDPSEGTLSFDVVRQPLGEGTCKTPEDYENVVFCFGPTGSPYTNSWGTDKIYVEYSLAGNADDPSYFAYNKIGKVIPSAATFHAASWVKVGKSFGHPTVKTPVDALVEMDYKLPPPQGEDTFFQFDGYLKILGQTIFEYSKSAQVTLTKEKDFTFYKKQKSWVIYRDTVMVGPVPVTFDFGASGQVGLHGSVYVNLSTNSDNQPTADLDLNVGAYANLGAYGEVAVGVLTFEAGVGVNLTLIDLEPLFSTEVSYFPPSSTTDPAVLLSGSVPFDLRSLGGKFYAFVKVLIHKWKTTIVSWKGLHWVWQVVPAKNFVFGPAGLLFLVDTVGGKPTSKEVGEVYHHAEAGHSYRWEMKIHLKKQKYNFSASMLGHVTLANAKNQVVFDDHAISCGKSTDQTTSFTPDAEDDYTLVALSDASCYKAAGNLMTLYWAEDGASAVVGDSGRFTSGQASGARSIWTEYYNTAPGNWGDPVLYDYTDEVKIQIARDHDFGVGAIRVHSPQEGLGVRWQGDMPAEVKGLQPKPKGLVFSFEGNPAYTDNAGCSVVDSLQLLVPGSTSPLPRLPVLDSNGKATVVVPFSGASSDYRFVISYHPASPGDNPHRCTITLANDANLKVTVMPTDIWLVKQNPGQENAFSIQAGPTDADSGTLWGGSLHIRALPPSPYFLSHYASGVFNFQKGGDFDFFVGATSSADYTVWIDGVRVASRSLASNGRPYDPTLDPDKGWVVRETLLTRSLTPGYHRIEMFCDQSAANAYASKDTLVTRLRWSPRTPNQQAILHFYRTPDELQTAIDPDPDHRENLQPILLMKDTSKDEMKLSWRGLEDCTAANGNQLDCRDSFLFDQVNVLWEGTYLLQSETDYYVETSPTGHTSDFPMYYFDDQQYFQYFMRGAQVYPFRGGAYHAILTTKPLQDEYASEPSSNKMAWGPNLSMSPQSPLALDMKWTALPRNSYKVLFFDIANTLLLTFTGDYTQGARPNGQRFCIGADCPQPILIPDGTAYGVIVASGLGDPNKQCFPADKYDSETANLAIDAILSLDIGWGRDPNKMWCMTNQCSSNQSQSPMSSTDFLEYKDSTDPTQRKGLFAQQRNAFLYYFSCSAQGCAADFQKLSLDLTYQAHAW